MYCTHYHMFMLAIGFSTNSMALNLKLVEHHSLASQRFQKLTVEKHSVGSVEVRQLWPCSCCWKTAMQCHADDSADHQDASNHKAFLAKNPSICWTMCRLLSRAGSYWSVNWIASSCISKFSKCCLRYPILDTIPSAASRFWADRNVHRCTCCIHCVKIWFISCSHCWTCSMLDTNRWISMST